MASFRARSRWWTAWVAALAISFFVVALPLPTHAQTTQAQPFPDSVKIETNTATPSFPDTIIFKFNAAADPTAPTFKSLELGYRIEGEVETNIRHTDLAPGDPLTSDVTIDTRKDYLPPGTRISYYWLLNTGTGDTYQTATQEFTYQDTRYAFRELKNGLFTVRWLQGDDKFGQAAMDRVVSTVDKLSQLYKVKPDLPINLTIYPDTRTMFTALPPNTQEWVGGQAIPELGTIVLEIAGGDITEIGRSIPHEVSHQVVYQATRNPYNVTPKWLDEGLAVNNQDKLDGFLVQAYEKARDDRTLFPLRVLNGSFPADSQLSYAAYGQSVMVVRYIIQKYGNAGIEKILASFKDGVSYDEAVQAGLGISLDQLDREWKESIGYPVPDLPAATPTPTPQIPTPLPTVAAVPTEMPSPTAAAQSSPTPAASKATPGQSIVPGVTPQTTQSIVPVVTAEAGTSPTATTSPGNPLPTAALGSSSPIRNNTTVTANGSGGNGNNDWLVAGLAGTAVILLGAITTLVVIALRKQS